MDEASVNKPGSEHMQHKNVKLMIFRLEQKIDEIEQRLDSELHGEVNEEELGKKEAINLDALVRSPTSTNPLSPLSTNKNESGLRGALARQEWTVNDINLRLGAVVGSQKKIDPDNIRNIIREIAELTMQRGKEEVTAEMDTLKGSQKHYGQLTETLKNELKIMDEKFKQDIDKKSEKKELYNTKTQLRKRVLHKDN